jgi:hypothetical protein
MRIQLSYSGKHSTKLWLPILNWGTVTGGLGTQHIQRAKYSKLIGFHSNANEVSILLGCSAASLGG